MTKKTRCPNCGVWHTIEEDPPKAGTFENRVRRPSFRTDIIAPTFPQQPEIINQAPAGLPSMDTHVRIPLRQAMISGLFDALEWFVIGTSSTGVLLIAVDAMPVDVAFTPFGLLVISGGGWRCEWPNRLQPNNQKRVAGKVEFLR